VKRVTRVSREVLGLLVPRVIRARKDRPALLAGTANPGREVPTASLGFLVLPAR
jgi:hypothetical protein